TGDQSQDRESPWPRCAADDTRACRRGDRMRRREFITFIGSAAATWPFYARAQQPTAPVVGFLYPGSPETMAVRVAALRQGLSEMGFMEGRNITIEYRWAYNELDRLQVLADD